MNNHGDTSGPSAQERGPGGRLPRFSLKNRFSGPLARCVFIGALTLFLLIPLGMVGDVVYDRAALYREAADDIRDGWGHEQLVSGPALIIPYVTWLDHKEVIVVDKKKEEVITRKYYQQYRVILPAELAFASVLTHEIRYRGIYRQALYTAPVDAAGYFNLPGLKDFQGNIHKIEWDDAFLTVGVSDLKSIAESVPAIWNNKTLPAYRPGGNAGGLLGQGFHVPVPLTAQEAGARRDFALKLTIRGSGGISFTPVGENTSISVSGDWPDPKFQSSLLPVERKVTPEGFSAVWKVSNLTRSYPQTGDMSEYVSDSSQGYSNSGSVLTSLSAGVDFYESVSLYRMVKRAVDYGILFIAVSFVALFAFEMLGGRRMHLLQYGMVGLSMSVFYLVLLSLAEHVSFTGSFLAAGAITVLMNSVYIAAAFSSRRKGLIMAGMLAALYAVLFSILRMEDIALLSGTALVLAMMGVLMYVTRKLPQG